jgi:hypothetical protein
MADQASAELTSLIRAPERELAASGVDIVPVQAGLFDADGGPLLVSFAGALPSMCGALAAVRSFFGNRWQSGDVALTNDMDAGAVNACEIILIAPIFADSALIGWSLVRGRVPDFGGWEPGGYSPQAVDRWAEGARLEPAKVMLRGKYRREVTDLLRLNSRTPDTTLANVRLLAEAAVKLGQAFARQPDLRTRVAALRQSELERVKAALSRLEQAVVRQRADVAARWVNQQFGTIEVAVAASAAGVRVTASGPPVVGCPINLGRFAAQDIAAGAIAGCLGLDDVITDALVTQLEVSVQTPGLLCAPLPTPVGIGRQVAGHVLFPAIAMSLGQSAADAEAAWQRYRDKVCGTGFDPDTGKLALAGAARIRERQSKEIAA